MQDADLFLELAAIAGVFVGFGALIAVRSGGPRAPEELAPMRGVVSAGALTIVAALAPVTLSRYDLGGHEIWASSSALVVVGWLLMFAAMIRTPEYRTGMAAEVEATWSGPSRWLQVVGWAVYGLYMIASLAILVVILSGAAPDLDAALYFTEVVLILAGAGWALMGLVFAQRSPAET